MWELMSTTGPQSNVGKRHWVKTHGDPERVIDAGAYFRCPLGQPGDQLWVRETWAYVPASAYLCSEGVQQTVCPTDPDMAAIYASGWDRSSPGRWRPSIHMPRWASRITLEITNIRVERIQDITEEDAKSEGAIPEPDHPFADTHNCRDAFKLLWNCLYGIPSWAANPWVWVIEFKRVTA